MKIGSTFLLVMILALSLIPMTVRAADPENSVGEKVPSEDDLIPNFHSLGPINGQTDIYRCACPVGELFKKKSDDTTQPSDSMMDQAVARMKRLHDLGIRTIISFQDADDETKPASKKKVEDEIALERAAAEQVGILYVARPMSNAGPNSLQTMTDEQVLQWLDGTSDEIFHYANTGGVAFHCTSGHDRTGIVSAYLRMKYEHWSVDQAIAEMRRLGHNWPKYSSNGGVSSWHEDHLRAIAKMLQQSNSN